MNRPGLIKCGGAAAMLALLGWSASAMADASEITWASEGYFRTRTVKLTNLAPEDRQEMMYLPAGETVVVPEIRKTSYIMSRFRLMPSVSYGKIAKFSMQMDGIDDVLWGDNNGVASSPLFATDGSNQYFLGQHYLYGGDESPTIAVKRAWLEFQIPVGVVRIGRMPSHWGMGLLANGGGSGHLDATTPAGKPARRIGDHFTSEDFGDKHFGSTADRIVFITKPLSIYKTITKQADTSSNFIMGYAFDVLSESPWLLNEGYERRFRPLGQQGYISRGANDDVKQHVMLAVYNDPDWEQVRYTDELRVGFYGVYRTAEQSSQKPSALDPDQTCGSFEGEDFPCIDTGSKVWIADIWWKIRYGTWFTEGELYKIGGTTFGGVPFPGQNNKKKADIRAGVARFGYVSDELDGLLELGHASGDDSLADDDLRQRAVHPDFNVGMILFEETLREHSARTYGVPLASETAPQGAYGFFSQGGVINANYLFPKVRYRPQMAIAKSLGLEVVGGVLMAWADKLGSTASLFYACAAVCGEGQTSSKYLGTELDLAVRTTFANGHMRLGLETAYLRFGEALKSQLPNADSSYTVQTSFMFLW